MTATVLTSPVRLIDTRAARGKHRAPGALAARLRRWWDTARPVGMISVAGAAAVIASALS